MYSTCGRMPDPYADMRPGPSPLASPGPATTTRSSLELRTSARGVVYGMTRGRGVVAVGHSLASSRLGWICRAELENGDGSHPLTALLLMFVNRAVRVVRFSLLQRTPPR